MTPPSEPAAEPPEPLPSDPAEPDPAPAAPAPNPAPPPSVGTRIVAGLLMIGATVGIGVYARSGGGTPQPEQAPPPAHPTPVNVVVVAEEVVPLEPRYLGQTGPSHRVEIRSRVAGYLTQREFTEGQRVEAGQPLFQVDPRPFEIELQESRARLSAAEARRERAGQQLARYRELSAKQAATQGELEEWEKEQRVAAAEVELLQAQIAASELRLDYASIEAPVDGVIGEALLDVGTYVNGNATDLLAVVECLDPLYVRYALSEQDLLRVERRSDSGELDSPKTGELELRVTLADGRVHPHLGRIDFLEPGLRESTGTATVRGVVPNPDGGLRPGQFVHVTVLGMQRRGVIRVPQPAVLHSPAGASVYVVGADDTVEARSVVLGDWLGEGFWVIEKGLKPGDRVIVNRLLTLRPGAPVIPTTVDAKAPAAEAEGAKAEGK